nr:MAG TPA: hypothetical protein [Caudoviricetes sp.]
MHSEIVTPLTSLLLNLFHLKLLTTFLCYWNISHTYFYDFVSLESFSFSKSYLLSFL